MRNSCGLNSSGNRTGNSHGRRRAVTACLCLIAILALSAGTQPAEDRADLRTKAKKAYDAGNRKDAYERYRKLALDPNDDPHQVGQDLQMAVACLQNLNRVNEIDAFREQVIEIHKDNWRLLLAAAENYLSVEHNGFLIAGEFERGQHRGGGRAANAFERDRVRALQLMVQAIQASEGEKDRRALGNLYLRFADALTGGRGYATAAWQMQYLTDLSQLPDHDDGYYYRRGSRNRGAPVDAEGNPIFYTVPKSFEDADSDGERWRWALAQAVEVDPSRKRAVNDQRARFLHSQFGVQTMRDYGWFGRGTGDDEQKDESGTYALHTLGENETIARLATGIKRFTLPDEHNFIALFKENNDYNTLATIFENRRQYDTAASYWRKINSKQARARLAQIVDNWGTFEPVMTHPAGRGATVEYRFRNGRQVDFEAYAIKVPELLADVKKYIKSRPSRIDGNRINIANIGYRLVHENEKKYIGEKVASWSLELEPRPRHFDRRITVSTPLQKAGAYLLIAKLKDGNVSRIVIWINDTVIVKKPLDQKTLYFIADAPTGKPIAKANVEFFGYRQERIKIGKAWTKWYRVYVEDFAEFSNADGIVIPDPKDQPTNYRWIITATNDEGRFAYLGFTGVWYGRRHDQQYNATKVFSITDRPVYRPGQAVKFKLWVRHAKYDREDTSDFANRQFTVEIRNAKNDKVLSQSLKADAYGGVDGEYLLPKDAALGQYRLYIVGIGGGGHFRVEEYKKPEFEVTVEAPGEPVMLGEKIPVEVKAKYYFGAPVTKAKVKYKVLRSNHSASWYPRGRWDWFYGPGYWWFGYDYEWYPGWYKWGCFRPVPWWWQRPSQPPEVVMENEVEIGEDGTVKIEIDTASAKEIHGDLDHRYEVTAEVVDESRRTIVGKGSVLVARRPFKVYAWVHRGHYRVGDDIRADFSAQTLDNKPVKGEGVLNLYRITYEKDEKDPAEAGTTNLKPVETSVQKWDLDTNDQGRASVQIKASRAGQYRLSYQVTDSKGHTIEGGYVFVIRGEGFDGAEYRFNDIELVTDKREYGNGDKVNLMINTNRAGGTVVLFVRPSNGVYLPPKVIRLTGKSTVEAIDVTKKDMPNFYVEAFTIADGKIHTETREVIVPPEKRVLNIEATPSKAEYKPGEKASVKVKLTDHNGEPFAGSTVMTIYDKSVEYISGGSNVPEIKAFFWKWRRRHNPVTESNLDRWFHNLLKKGEISMQHIGVFGHTVADETRGFEDSGIAQRARSDVDREMVRTEAVTAFARGGVMTDAALAPAAARAPMPALAVEAQKEGGTAPGEPAAPEVQPTVRKEFADTAFWIASLDTDKQGFAEISLTMPENLTGWKIKTWAMGHGTKVGQAEADVVTKKNLMLRLQAPRFFVEKDEVVLSANIHNYLKNKKAVRAVLELEGGCLELMEETMMAGRVDAAGNQEVEPILLGAEPIRIINIAAGGEKRVDWRVKVVREGEAVVRMKALTDEESDAMEMKFPVYVHGMDKMVAFSGYIRPDKDSATVTLEVPKERRIGESRLEIRYSPTLAAAMVDALPYLVDYPYGCTEQTLSRFLPTVITQKILLEMGVDLKDVQEKRTNLNAQEIGDDLERAKQWKRYDRNPVFDEAEVRRMVKQGVKALTEMQLRDGGWGWFSGLREHSWPHTTAYVVHGLQIARENDVAIVPGVIENGVAWLKRHQKEQVRLLKLWDRTKKRGKRHADNLDAFVYMVLVDADVDSKDMREYLYRDRNELAVYAKAMFGIALHKQKHNKERDMLIRNIEQFLVRDDENQTAYLNLGNQGYWWYWYGSEYEAHAYYLKLLAKTGRAKDWKAPYLVKYLLNNRKHATYWKSTRDTAVCIEAFADYLRATDEHKPDLTVEILLDGKKHKEVRITVDNIFTFDNKLVLEGDAIESGEHKVEFRKKGTGPLYFNAYLSYFSLEDFITSAGLEVKVQREVYKLTSVDKTIKVAGSRGQVVDQKVEKYERSLLETGATLKSGDLVEIELVIESKNDYEYLVFEDMKAAGFEPVDVRSGYTGNEMGAYVEFRDNRVVFFVRHLARGRHSVTYRTRAEIPGKFSALPTHGYAMYAPELRGNSDEIKLAIED